MKLFYCKETSKRCLKEACPFFNAKKHDGCSDLEVKDVAVGLPYNMQMRMNNSQTARPELMYRF